MPTLHDFYLIVVCTLYNDSNIWETGHKQWHHDLVNYQHDSSFHTIWIIYEIMYFKCDKMKLQTAHVEKTKAPD